MSRKTKILLIGVLIFTGLILVLYFGFRAFQSHQRIGRRGPPPAVMDVEQIRGWMTIEYISKTFKIPEPVIFESIGIPETGNSKKTIQELGKRYYPEQPNLIMEKLKEGINRQREKKP